MITSSNILNEQCLLNEATTRILYVRAMRMMRASVKQEVINLYLSFYRAYMFLIFLNQVHYY
jgi:hypothetical protein